MSRASMGSLYSFGDYEGNKFRYLRSGYGTARTALLMHGYSFSCDVWAESGTMACFLESGYSVTSLDMPGYPNSGSKFAMEERAYPDFIDYVVKNVVKGRPVLLGSSLSGYFALRYASLHAPSIKALIVVAPVRIPEVRLEKIKVPTLGIWGSDDMVSTPGNAGSLSGAISDSETCIIDGAAHACYLDKPAEFNERISAFLAKLH